VKDAAGHVHQEGKIGSTRRELDAWIKTLPQPRTIAMEATIFTGWIYDQLLPHAEKVKVAHPLMLRAIAAAKRKNDRIDAGKIADCELGTAIHGGTQFISPTCGSWEHWRGTRSV
jgi:transposase